MTLGLLLIVGPFVAAGLLAFAQLAAPGPSRPITAVRRYGVWPYATAIAVAAATATAILSPASRPHVASLAVLAVHALFLANVRWRLLARVVFRARWVSVARSCGLGVRRDIRGRSWPFDSTTTLGDQRVESLPVIYRPRTVPGVGVKYLLRPARGGTVTDVAQASEALAAGLHVARIEVSRLRADRGELTAVWR